jgi:hypothetical protein
VSPREESNLPLIEPFVRVGASYERVWSPLVEIRHVTVVFREPSSGHRISRRPRLTLAATATIRVAPETRDRLDRIGAVRGPSAGELLDELASQAEDRRCSTRPASETTVRPRRRPGARRHRRPRPDQTNILDNALRYSPPGTPIHLNWAAADESTVEITVRDHGPGIEPSLLPHVFEPGIRGAPAAGSSDSGAGLGLAIAKRLLEHQHAGVTIRNEQSGGAVISLPLRRASAANPP